MNAEPPKTSQQVQRARDIEALTKLWQAGMPTIPPPPIKQFELWFQIHAGDFGTLAYGLEQCARLYIHRRGHMDQDHCIKHSSRVMNGYSRARRKKPVEHFPMNVLTKNLADELGLPAGMALTKEAFWRCHARLQAIQAGRVKRPNGATETNKVAQS
jgi:hypothetical protein